MSPSGTKPDNPSISKVESRIKDASALAAGREKLLKGARECFSRKGFGGTSVQDIAEAAGISIGSVYKYVRAKEDLLFLMAEGAHARLQGLVDHAFATSDDPVDALGVAVDALVRNADTDRDLMSLLYAEFKYMPAASKKLIRDQEALVLDRLTELIEAGNRSGTFSCDDPRSAALTIEMFGSTWVLKRYAIDQSLDAYVQTQILAARRLVGAKPAASESPVVRVA